MAQMRKTAQHPALGGNFWVLEPGHHPSLGVGRWFLSLSNRRMKGDITVI